MIIVTTKENGSSQSPEKGDQVEVTERLVNDDEEIAGILVDQSGPILQHQEDDTLSKFQAKIDEPAGLDEFASNEVIAESIVVASINGDQVTLVHDEISTIGGVISTETEICAATNLENPGIDVLDNFEKPHVTDNTVGESESHTKETLESGIVNASEEATGEVGECASKHSEQNDAEVEIAGQMAKKNQKQVGTSLHSDESGGKELPKGGRFAIRADLNINSRPRRSVPRRSVFELLQGEIRPAGPSRRQLADTGSESDPEPGSSKRAPRRSRGSTNERSDVTDKSRRKREEKSQEARPTKRRNKERDEEMTDSCKSRRKKSTQSSCGVESSSEAQADVFVADDFDLVETVVGVDSLSDLEEDDDNLTLARLRKESRRHSSDREPSDDRNDSSGDVGVDIESNLEDLEYNSRWHSYATPRKLDSPPRVQETSQSAKHRGGYHHSRVSAAASFKKSYITEKHVQKHQDIMTSETPVNKDYEKSGTPWYLAGSTSSETFLNDPTALQSRIDELLKVNTDLRSRLKEVEGKGSIKKFNIDFQSRKFSKVREPVFGSGADRKSMTSSGRVGAGASSERGSGAGGVGGKDLKHKEVSLNRREAKLRALDVELDERTMQLKANEGKLLRTERRLKEIERTLEYRERVLKRLETNGDRKESEKTGGDVGVPGSPEQLPGAASGSAVETDMTKLERKEQELERLRRFLSEEREKLLPKQQRLTKWDAALKRKEEEIQLREHRLLSTGVAVARKRHISGSGYDDSDSDDVQSPPLKPLNSKSTISVHKTILNMKKRKMVSLKVFKVEFHNFICKKLIHKIKLLIASDRMKICRNRLGVWSVAT